MTDQQPDFEALARTLTTAMTRAAFRFTAVAALGAALDQDDDRLVATVERLDAEQAGEIVDAASAVGVAASRRRKQLAGDDQADDGEFMEVRLRFDADGTGHFYATDDQADEPPSEPVAHLREQIANTTNGDRIDFGALNAAIADALERWHEPGVAYDPAGQLAAVRSAVDPFLFDLRDRADGRVAFIERQRAAWEADAKRHLDNADYWWKRAEEAEATITRAHALANELRTEEAYGGRADGLSDAADRLDAILDQTETSAPPSAVERFLARQKAALDEYERATAQERARAQDDTDDEAEDDQHIRRSDTSNPT